MDKNYRKLEEGGILGFYNVNGLDTSRLMLAGMYALQHRGQTGCGITLNDNFILSEVKGRGTVAEVIEPKLFMLSGAIGLGHLKYGSIRDTKESLQPLNTNYLKGSISVALGGTISDSEAIKEQLEQKGAIFQVGNDAEILAHLIARERVKAASAEQAVAGVLKKIDGAFACLIMTPSKLIAFRDKKGFRPMCMGRVKDSIIFASEDVAFAAMGAEFIRDVAPGEVILVNKDCIQTVSENKDAKAKTCIYEYLYFARPDSIIDGASVYAARINAGKELFEAHPVEADVVIGVPSAGLHFALGYANRSGIPFGDGLIKNYYLGRAADSGLAARESSLNIKLNVMRHAVDGLRVCLVDDSMIKGLTAKKIIAKLKAGGAREVHVRIACPRFLSPCPYSHGLDSSLGGMSIDGIKEMIGADSLGFLPNEKLDRIGVDKECCKGCFRA